MPRWRLKTFLIALSFACLLMAVGKAGWDRVTGHVAPEGLLRQLQPDMTMSEVFGVLGPPTVQRRSVTNEPPDWTTWTYRRFLCPERLDLFIDERGRLQAIDDDNGLASLLWHDAEQSTGAFGSQKRKVAGGQKFSRWPSADRPKSVVEILRFALYNDNCRPAPSGRLGAPVVASRFAPAGGDRGVARFGPIYCGFFADVPSPRWPPEKIGHFFSRRSPQALGAPVAAAIILGGDAR